MKKELARALGKFFLISGVWTLVDLTFGLISRAYNLMGLLRGREILARQFRKGADELCPGMAVLHGPFQGMKYPSPDSIGSALLPKLLGSYESELSHIVEEICGERYETIVDIGCAEGYYANGLARRMPNTRVFAFDTNHKAREVCRKMAELNGVSDRVVVGGFCSGDSLKSLALGRRALIISDCEGYEHELFSRDVLQSLSRHDFLIETHDSINIEITSVMLQRFEATHRTEIVQSIDDVIKAYTYVYPELSGLDLSERKRILAEWRPIIMRWIWATSKQRGS